MNGEGYRDPTADRAIRNAGRLPRPIWNVVKAVREVLNVSHLELVEKEAADHRADERVREQSRFSVQSAALQDRRDSVHL